MLYVHAKERLSMEPPTQFWYQGHLPSCLLWAHIKAGPETISVHFVVLQFYFSFLVL